ncbi:lysyl oxidase homolog 2-like [Haliotis rufescens]|uniref:lysyl oxidase homolog 2-like n=1 Tax=Haliotis rufescens TaxID=6454 RepID=UPI00201EEDE0|nr:lysyl oxidase homolog 2-like [Haliotis rufescens]WUR08116.1 lysyl oxidase [Haliotis discus hannai]
MNIYNCVFSCVCFLVTICVALGRRRGPRFRSGDVRLVGGNESNEGTVLVYHRHSWGAICDKEWDFKDADVVCKELGFLEAHKATYGSQFGKGSNRKWMSNVRCSGYEDKLKYCMFLGWGRMRRGCYGSRHSAGVVCRPHPTTPVSTTTTTRATTTTLKKIITPKKNQAHKKHIQYLIDRDNRLLQKSQLQGDAPAVSTNSSEPGLLMRMVGGRYDWEGRIEVKEEHSEWGAICGEKWSIKEAMVACREIGQTYGKQALQVNYFGGENLDKHYYQIKCKGREMRLDQCEKIRTDVGVTCSKPNLVAGIVCTHRLPDLIPDLEILEESVRLADRPLYYLQCAMEENCLAASAAVIRNTSKNWHAHNRRLLRFSTVVHNEGLEDFRPYRAKSAWEWHECHMHYHSMEVFAHYDVIDEHGNRLAEGQKASFCLEDSACQDGVVPKFDCVGFRDQGLSVNCSDNYMYDIDCQWIDITGIKPGQYRFQMEVNPTLMVAESDFDNNVASCELWYSGYNARIFNCEFQSLLSD